MTKTRIVRGIPRILNRGAKPPRRIRPWSVLPTVSVFVILIASAVMASCGQNGARDGATDEAWDTEKNPRTVEEYAEPCTGKLLTDYDTVYEMVDDLKIGLDNAHEINPPRELKEFHDVSIRYTEELIKASRLLPGTTRPSLWMFSFSDPQQTRDLFRANDELNTILYDLDPDVRETLQRHGCIE